MKKVLLIVLTIILLTGCNDLKNFDSMQEITSNDNEQESIDNSEEMPRIDVYEVSDSTPSVNDIIEVENFLYQEVKELEQLEKYIYQKSNEEAFMVIESDVTLHKLDFEGTEDEYYLVYVGEQYNDRKVNWCWFYVNQNLDRILSYDIVEGEVYTLLEWRETELYSEKFGFINE